jgi:hypothetical protein
MITDKNICLAGRRSMLVDIEMLYAGEEIKGTRPKAANLIQKIPP